jgi:transcriptional regulator with XRE-family HTH domain
MFENLSPLDEFTYKKMAIASCLNAAMVSKMKTRSALAEQLGWSKSYMTRFLSGKSNLTLRTIWEFTNALGYDVDLAIHEAGTVGPLQPWQASNDDASFTPVFNQNEAMPAIQMYLHTWNEVANDLINGNHSSHYLSIKGCSVNEQSENSKIEFNQASINSIFNLNPSIRIAEPQA